MTAFEISIKLKHEKEEKFDFSERFSVFGDLLKFKGIAEINVCALFISMSDIGRGN